jgi:hypothetical protein
MYPGMNDEWVGGVTIVFYLMTRRNDESITEQTAVSGTDDGKTIRN